MGRRVFLDDEKQAELETRGYTIVRLLSTDEAAEALTQVQSLSPTDSFAPDGTGRYPATYHCTFLDPDPSYKRSVDTLNRGLFEERMCGLLDDYRMLTSNLYVKAPGAGQFEIHQNWPVTDDIRDTTLTLWCPFTDVDPRNGTISIVPASHKIVPDIFTVTAPKYFAEIAEELIRDWLVPVPLQAGECLMFDDGLLHWSGVNDSDDWRWSAQLVFMPAERTPVVYYYDVEHDPPRFEMYEITPEFFIQNEMSDVTRRPSDLPFHGVTERPTTVIDRGQFERLMELGPTTRRKVYEGASLPDAFADALEVLARPRTAVARDREPAVSSVAASVPAGVKTVPATAGRVDEPGRRSGLRRLKDQVWRRS